MCKPPFFQGYPPVAAPAATEQQTNQLDEKGHSATLPFLIKPT
jgi:hypothetical protein